MSEISNVTPWDFKGVTLEIMRFVFLLCHSRLSAQAGVCGNPDQFYINTGSPPATASHWRAGPFSLPALGGARMTIPIRTSQFLGCPRFNTLVLWKINILIQYLDILLRVRSFFDGFEIEGLLLGILLLIL